MTPDWAQTVLAGLAGLGLVGCVFWFAFRRPPERRRKEGAPDVTYDATFYGNGDEGGCSV